MKKLTNFIVKNYKIIFAIFIVLVIIAGTLIYFVYQKTNYDLTEYLPKNYETSDGYKILKKYFNVQGDVELAMTSTEKQAKNITKQIKADDGVAFLLWYDDLTAVEDFEISKEKNKYYYDELIPVFRQTNANDPTKFDYSILISLKDSPSTPEALKSIKQIKSILTSTLGEKNFAIKGITQIADDMYESTLSEILVYCAIAGAIVVIILLVTTSSLTEPIILLMVMVFSIILNLGTNIIFPSNSIITFACSAVLQLGLSMDYAIFLSNAYNDKLKINPDPKEAMKLALPETTKAIATSALTSIGGFLALIAMQFTIGMDLGLVLAKGIVMSFLCVLFMQPALMLMSEKGRKKTQHTCLNVKFRPIIKRTIKWRPLVLAFLLLLIPPIFYVEQFTLNYSYIKFLEKNGTSTEEIEEMAKTLGNQVIISLPIDSSPETIDKHYKFVEELKKMEVDKNGNKENGEIAFTLGLFTMIPDNVQVTADLGYGAIKTKSNLAISAMIKLIGLREKNGADNIEKNPSSNVDKYISMGSMLISHGQTLYTIGINPNINIENSKSFDVLTKVQTIAENIFCPKDANGNNIIRNELNERFVNLTGISQLAKDFVSITPRDFVIVTIISVVVIFVIILCHLKSFKLSLLLICLIEFGIWLNLAMQHIFPFSHGTINFMSYMIIGAIQLGSTVDYAILIASKYKELRKRFAAPQAAYMATTSSVTSILASAAIMAGACFSVFFIASNPLIKEITFLVARSSVIASVLVIFFLPALLSIFDKNHGGEIHFPISPKLRPITLSNIKILENGPARTDKASSKNSKNKKIKGKHKNQSKNNDAHSTILKF